MIAERVKKYVDEKGIKQLAIADAIGMSRSAMSQTLRGERTMTAEEFVKICDFLEVPYDKFTAPDPAGH